MKNIKELEALSRLCRGDILKMTTIAQSGHPGGSMSSLELYLSLYAFANISPENLYHEARDRIVISHGHTAPGIYSVLGRLGFFSIDEAIAYFRKAGSIFEGHVEPSVPGIEWATGNLGQGLSAGCGFALAGKQKGLSYKVFVAMGDGEQQKGQIAEARRFAKKYQLNNITVLIDYNKLQISGSIDRIMPQNIIGNYQADGWDTVEIDGHDFQQIFAALQQAVSNDSPTAIIAHTVMGKGVSFMENDETFHGKALSEEQCRKALAELDLPCDLELYKEMRSNFIPTKNRFNIQSHFPKINTGTPKVYQKDTKVACRDAYGNALVDLISINKNSEFAVFDCDLAGSVRTEIIEKKFPAKFYQGGIQEHNTAVVAGTVSKEGIISFFSDFGVFGIDETYNQQRLNDINHTNLKLVTTHVGLDVGEDGKTHQCIDYIGIIRNLFGFKIIIPGDANQTDRIIRYISTQPGNFVVPIPRSKSSIILDESGEVYYNLEYKFEYGKADQLRKGKVATIISTGIMIEKALEVFELLAKQNIYISVWNFSCLSDINPDDLKAAASTGYIFTYEDHNVNTGLGNIIAEKLVEYGIQCKLIRFGVEQYGVSGKNEEVYKTQGLDADSVVKRIKKILLRRKLYPF